MMETVSSFNLVSRDRALLTIFVTVLLVVFNYGTNITSVTNAMIAIAIFLVIGYGTFTLLSLFANRFWWKN